MTHIGRKTFRVWEVAQTSLQENVAAYYDRWGQGVSGTESVGRNICVGTVRGAATEGAQ